MQSRGSSNRLSGLAFRSRIWALLFSMFATMAALYVAGRLWQDAQSRVYLIKELDRITGLGQSAISVDDTLKVIACREQQKRLSALEMELAAAKQEGFVSKSIVKTETNGTYSRKRLLTVIGILTQFGRKNNRDAIRKAWMSTGAALKKLEEEKGIVIRFVIGRSSNRGDSLDRDIDKENRQHNDFLILDNHAEAPELISTKSKLFFAHAADTWDAEFYTKVNDDVYVNIDPLGALLETHLDKPRLYMGCMKSGEVFSEPTHRWYEPEWWKFGDGKSYFRHASGEMFVISQALAQFISINKAILRTYAHDDVSAGSWFIGLDVKHIDEPKFCCSTWNSGAICAAV
ncbi:Hydroxyproline O-galactosyltransferase HPGT1 [Ranunculus cassubicifolius]